MAVGKTLTRTERDKLVVQMREWLDDGYEKQKRTFKRMSRAERYRNNDQWTKQLTDYHEAKGRCQLTINRILPTVMHVVGQQVQNPMDIEMENLTGRSAAGAKVMSSLVKQSLDANEAQAEETRMFDDGATTGRGWIGCDVDYSHDPLSGDIEIQHRDPFNVLPDPTRKSYDPNRRAGGARYIAEEVMRDKEWVEAKYPKSKKDLETVSFGRENTGLFARILNSFPGFGGRQTRPDRDGYRDYVDREGENVDVFENADMYLVSTVWWKKWVKGAWLLDRSGEHLVMIPARTSEEQKRAKEIAEQDAGTYAFIDKDVNGNPIVLPLLHKTVLVGDVLLEHVEDPFDGMHDFPLVPYSAYFYHGYEFGIVDNLISPQDQINWAWTMELFLVRKLANTGYIIKQDMGGYKKWLEQHGGEDGVILESAKAGGEISRLEPSRFPTQMDAVVTRGSQYVSEIAGVRLEKPEFDDKNQSGRAILAKQAAAKQGSALIMLNYTHTLKIFGRVLAGIIRSVKVYSEEEIRQVVEKSDLIDPDLMAAARQSAIGALTERLAIRDQRLLEPPTPTPQALAGDMTAIAQFQEDKKVFDQMQAMIDELAEPAAFAMLLQEFYNIRYNKLTTKVSLSQFSETRRLASAVEVFELNAALVESGQEGVPRNVLIDSTDVKDKELIKAGSMQGAA